MTTSKKLLNAKPITKIVLGCLLSLLLPLAIVGYVVFNKSATILNILLLIGIVGIFVFPIGVVLIAVGYVERSKGK